MTLSSYTFVPRPTCSIYAPHKIEIFTICSRDLTAQLVEHRTGVPKVVGSSSTEVDSFFDEVGIYWTTQGGNEVCFFIADPIIARKFLILDSKSMTNFRPWSHKYGTAWSLKKLLIPIPWSVIPDPSAAIPDPTLPILDPWSHIPRYDPELLACSQYSME